VDDSNGRDGKAVTFVEVLEKAKAKPQLRAAVAGSNAAQRRLR